MADSSPPPIEKIIERAYFHVGNGGLTLSVVEDRSPKDGTAEYRFKHEISVFGAKAESSFPLGSSDIVSWMNMALQRVSMKVAAAYHSRDYQPFDNPADVTHVNGMEVQKLASLMRIVARYQRAKEFSNPEALHDYLHEHPQADKSLHTVKKPGEEKPEGEEPEAPKKSWKERLQAISQKAKDFVAKAPGEIKKFVEDENHRRGVLQKIHKGLENLPKVTYDNAKKALKHEAHEFKTAVQGVKALLKGEKMTKEQKHAIKAVAFDVALTLATAAVTGGLGAGVKGLAGKSVESFAKSLAKKIAYKSLEESLGHATTLEELGHFGHGIQHLVTEHLAGEAKGDDADLLTAYITKVVSDQLKDLDPDTLAEAIEEAAGE